MVATIVDVSSSGLSVMHFSEEIRPDTALNLDIVLPGGEALLPELNGRVIWDSPVNGKRVNLFPQRRCGIEFRELTQIQKNYIKSLIHYYTEKG